MRVEEPGLEGVDAVGGKRHALEGLGEGEGGHAGEKIGRGGEGDAEVSGDEGAAGCGKGAVLIVELGPAAGVEGGAEADGVGDGEPGGRVEGAGPVEAVVKVCAAGAAGVFAVGDDGGADGVLAVGADVEEGCAFGSADPFVEISGVVGGAEGIEFEGDAAGGVCAIDEAVDAALVEEADDFFYRKDEGSGAGDVVDKGEAGALGDRAEDGVDDLLVVGEREGDAGDDDFGTGAAGGFEEDAAAGVVVVVGGEDFVAGLKVE